ncbi:MAG: sterol desaturase family protein [Eudoraea sp.]|nr:sterol desaturase family protein [Eudoraea sp.]
MNFQDSTFQLWLLVSGLLVLRYVLVAGIPFLFFYVLSGKKLHSKKIQAQHPATIKIFKEIVYSFLSLFIYGLGIWIFVYWMEQGVTLRYNTIPEYGIGYFFISLGLMIVLHDTYFYWTHRLIHHRYLFKYVHKVHHQFTNPTPWSAFSFHPLEAIISMGIIPIIIFCIPWHQSALITFVTFMTFYDVYIHLGFDLKQLRMGHWQNTAVDHNYHHQNARVNFGLYFTVWDQLMNTYKKLP